MPADSSHANVEQTLDRIGVDLPTVPHARVEKAIDLRGLHDEIEATYGGGALGDSGQGLVAVGTLEDESLVVIYPSHPETATITQEQLDAAVASHQV